MHKIYFDERSICICAPDEPLPEVDGAEILRNGGTNAIFSAIESFKSKDHGRSFILASSDTDSTYALVCSAFKEVNAAGGLVMDKDGKYLLIRRNSVWDLPKGHQEEGEDMVTTAVREVEEETGAGGLAPEKLLCITDHCYYRDGICHLKHTWWYLMSCKSTMSLTPQTEEDIMEAVFVGKDDLGAILECTYPSIRDVFMAASTEDETFFRNHRI